MLKRRPADEPAVDSGPLASILFTRVCMSACRGTSFSPHSPLQPGFSMTLPIQLAESRLLLPAGLEPGGLERTFGTLLGPGIDFGDLYFQHARRESWTVEDGIVKEGAHSIEQGVGVRAIS